MVDLGGGGRFFRPRGRVDAGRAFIDALDQRVVVRVNLLSSEIVDRQMRVSTRDGRVLTLAVVDDSEG